VTVTQDALWDEEPELAGQDASRRPDLTPTADHQGLKVGDRIQMSWTDASKPVPAQVVETTVFGALVTVDPTGDPSWACGPFDMYVTQQCTDGTWAR
jgi:hypothetical protein